MEIVNRPLVVGAVLIGFKESEVPHEVILLALTGSEFSSARIFSIYYRMFVLTC